MNVVNLALWNRIKVSLTYLKYIVLSIFILYVGLLIIPGLGSMLFTDVVGRIDPMMPYMLIVAGPWSVGSWLVVLVAKLVSVWPFLVFIVWAVIDSRKFKAKGINTRPYLWGLGMIFPLILVVFPFYFICRNITWLKEKKEIISASKGTTGLLGWYNGTNSMTKNTKIKINKVVTILKWTVIVLIGLFILVVLFQIPWYIENKKTDEQVAKIHATKLTMDDVMGKNLPSDPGVDADKTVAGIDANENGIRDDVELAIFKEYPNSAKTRAVLLQYALALQMEVTQPFENEKNVTEVVREESRADSCVSDTLVPRKSPESWRSPTEVKKINQFISFVKEKQFNTQERIIARTQFFKRLGSYTSMDTVCDIDFSKPSN